MLVPAITSYRADVRQGPQRVFVPSNLRQIASVYIHRVSEFGVRWSEAGELLQVVNRGFGLTPKLKNRRQVGSRQRGMRFAQKFSQLIHVAKQLATAK